MNKLQNAMLLEWINFLKKKIKPWHPFLWGLDCMWTEAGKELAVKYPSLRTRGSVFNDGLSSHPAGVTPSLSSNKARLQVKGEDCTVWEMQTNAGFWKSVWWLLNPCVIQLSCHAVNKEEKSVCRRGTRIPCLLQH